MRVYCILLQPRKAPGKVRESLTDNTERSQVRRCTALLLSGLVKVCTGSQGQLCFKVRRNAIQANSQSSKDTKNRFKSVMQHETQWISVYQGELRPFAKDESGAMAFRERLSCELKG